jgi:hypothetical protein
MNDRTKTIYGNFIHHSLANYSEPVSVRNMDGTNPMRVGWSQRVA